MAVAFFDGGFFTAKAGFVRGIWDASGTVWKPDMRYVVVSSWDGYL